MSGPALSIAPAARYIWVSLASEPQPREIYSNLIGQVLSAVADAGIESKSIPPSARVSFRFIPFHETPDVHKLTM